jgi:S1-C subfamily serine protease
VKSRSEALEEQNRVLREAIERIVEERARLDEAFREEVEKSSDLQKCLSGLMARDKEREASLSKVLERTEAVSTAVTSIQESADAAQRIYGHSHRGVGFITLGVSFYHTERKAFLRERLNAQTGLPEKTGLLLTLGGDGKKIIEWVSGSGFLVSKDGLVLTNRHVVDPWWGDEDFGQGLLERGFRAVREHFFVAFPGRELTIPLTRLGTHESMDVALCRLGELDEFLPVLPLGTSEFVREGDKVVLLGYPEGLQGLVNKLSRTQAEELRKVSGADRGALTRTLASLGGIVPTLTQGVLSNRSEESLVYDAVTTSGGSGGPLFDRRGSVIGVNSAISRNFSGANFGLPIAIAQTLIADRGEQKESMLDEVEVDRATAEAERVTLPVKGQ